MACCDLALKLLGHFGYNDKSIEKNMAEKQSRLWTGSRGVKCKYVPVNKRRAKAFQTQGKPHLGALPVA
jgi:hypothetical protein